MVALGFSVEGRKKGVSIFFWFLFEMFIAAVGDQLWIGAGRENWVQTIVVNGCFCFASPVVCPPLNGIGIDSAQLVCQPVPASNAFLMWFRRVDWMALGTLFFVGFHLICILKYWFFILKHNTIFHRLCTGIVVSTSICNIFIWTFHCMSSAN